jgi:hypothetical protein
MLRFPDGAEETSGTKRERLNQWRAGSGAAVSGTPVCPAPASGVRHTRLRPVPPLADWCQTLDANRYPLL